MPASGKRLDLRFGVFACSVQGFDDPVQPVQQILRAIQHLLEETPELADAGINFDPETIERLVGEVAQRAEIDEDQVEIVPGLVLIHHAGGGDLARGDDAAARAPAGDATTDYVNIFAARGGDESSGDEAAGAPGEDLAARMDRMTGADRWDEGAGNGAQYGWDETEDPAGARGAGGHMFAMRDERSYRAGPEEAGAEEGDEAAPANLFAAADDAEGAAGDTAAEVHNLFAETGETTGETTGEETAEDAAEAYHRARSGNGRAPDEPPAPAGDEAGSGDEAAADAAAADEGYTAASLAERAGAKTVPDLMVCAAAWMVLIQGSTQFKRRDVLDVFEKIPGDHDRSLEAQIKGFGKAVRNGHLIMVGDGVFGLSRDDLEWFQNRL